MGWGCGLGLWWWWWWWLLLVWLWLWLSLQLSLSLWLFVVRCSLLFVASCLLCVACCLLLVVCWLLVVGCCWLLLLLLVVVLVLVLVLLLLLLLLLLLWHPVVFFLRRCWSCLVADGFQKLDRIEPGFFTNPSMGQMVAGVFGFHGDPTDFAWNACAIWGESSVRRTWRVWSWQQLGNWSVATWYIDMDRHGCNSLASPSCSTISQAHQGCGPSHSLVSMLGTQWRYDFVALQDEGYGNPNKSGRASGGVPSIPESHLWGTGHMASPTPGSRLKGAASAGGVPKFAGPVLDGLLGVHHGAVREPKVFRCHGKNYPRPDTLWGCQVHIELWLFACDSEGHGNGLI